MEVKMLEIRDHGTFIPVMCIATKSDVMEEHYLLRRLGFSSDTHLIQLVWIGRGLTQYDPMKWNDRTFFNAHDHITKTWKELKSGDVVDVAYILGETDKPKISERYNE